MIVFNYSATLKAFVIYLTELLRVAKQRQEFFTLANKKLGFCGFFYLFISNQYIL